MALEPSGQITFERVGDGVLISMENGYTISFDTVAHANEFAMSLLRICAFGVDALDQAPEWLP